MFSKRDLQVYEQNSLERLLITGVWEAPGWAQILVSRLREEDFTDWVSRQGYVAMRSLLAKGEEIGLFSMRGELNNRKQMEAFRLFTAEMENAPPVTRHGFEQLMDWVRDRSFRRRGRRALENCLQVMADEDLSLEQIHQRCAQSINLALAGSKKTWPENIADTLGELQQGLMAAHESGEELPTVYLPTPFSSLNKEIRGFALGRYVGLVAKPGDGKTSCGLEMATAMATPETPTLVFSHEMSKQEVSLRVASQFLQKPVKMVETCPELLEKARLWAESRGIHVYDEPIEYHQIPTVVEGFKLQHPGLRSIMVDYLTRYCDQDAKEVARASKVVQSLARRHNLVTLVLLQFNREGEKLDNPGLEHIIGSSQIRMDAATLMILRRNTGGDPSKAKLEIAKDRFGEKAIVKLQWLGATTTFRELEPAPSGEQLGLDGLPEGVEVPL